MITRLATMVLLWVASTGAAFAVFSTAEVNDVPEPATAALLAAGGLVYGGVSYQRKRRRDK